ncbi:CopD family copper resistance protein [Parapusillimonas granuli]|uniref:Integral membrane protein n=1 Tax=Parapusillimonas granuli TaxID=380911 RepID=A0A853FZA3_9BURK|nr:hypothetical protein [Parapusillimonas granuli]MBB5214610.1 hypothetical protein [Parapusillimonas granuli]MEB2398142.1 hypothetical protein [Alcaligenaceae bacterium]NYT48982.1 hypothetical protein [Parapusillimonas granuli]
MNYALLLTLHLFAALIFIGTVFFEVLILENVRKHVPRDVMRTMEIAIGTRARGLMPWVLLVLYSAGIGMAWEHRAVLAHPFESSMGLMLTIKIVLALSVLGHFFTAMTLRKKGKLHSVHFQRIHLSVFCHMVGIVLLAKAMFYLHW